jgi:hypothetical protein
MSGMIVHGVPGSPYVRAALLTLEEKGGLLKFGGNGTGHPEARAAFVASSVRPHSGVRA